MFTVRRVRQGASPTDEGVRRIARVRALDELPALDARRYIRAALTASASTAAPPQTRPSFAADIAAWASGLLLAAPVLALRYPPMGDLPFHESLVALLRHFGDPSWQPAGLYARNFGVPNQLFHLVGWALSLALPTDTACKLVVAASILATPPSAARLARHFGTSPWSALLVAPLTLGFAFRWGLVGNVVALPIVLLSLTAFDRFAADCTPRRSLAALGLVILLYLAHESALVVGVMAITLFAVRADGGAGRRVARLVPAGVGVALAAFYAVWSRHLKAPSILSVPDAFGMNPVARLLDTPNVLFGALPPWILRGTFALYAVSFAPFVIARFRSNARSPGGASLAVRIQRHRLLLVACACAAAFLAMPLASGGSTLLYQRFLPVSVALLAVALAPAGARLWPIAPVLAASTSLAMLLVALPAFGTADRVFRELDSVLPLIERDSAVAQLDLTPGPVGAVAPIPGAGARALAERGGRLLFSFTDAPTSPVVVPASRQWNEPVLRLVRDPLAFSPPNDLRRFRYALVRLAPESRGLAPALVAIMRPEARLAADSGEWLLFESALDRMPLTAPDQLLAVPPTPTLRTRLEALMRRRAP